MTLYAKYEDALYSLCLNLNGLQGYPIILTAPNGEVITKPEDPVRQGYNFEGWYTNNSGKGEPYVFTTMPAGDGITSRNSDHFPQFNVVDSSIGVKDKEGNLIKHSDKKLKKLYHYNLSTLEGRYRGNTIFLMQIIQSEHAPQTGVVVYSKIGATYDRQAALYIHENNLAIVQNIENETLAAYRLIDVSDELLYGYNRHLNSSTSPVTTNPYLRWEDYSILSSKYKRLLDEYGQEMHVYNGRTPSDFEIVYNFICTTHDAEDYNYNYLKLVDENNNPLQVGGYHATDKNGRFLYDEHNQPIRAFERFQPTNNDLPFFVLELYAKWSYIQN